MRKKIIAQAKDLVIKQSNGSLILNKAAIKNSDLLKLSDIFELTEDVLGLTIDNCDLSNRTKNALTALNILTPGQLSEMTFSRINRSRGIGQEVFKEIIAFVAAKSTAQYQIVEYTLPADFLSDSERVIISEDNGVLLLDYNQLYHTNDLVILDLLNIPEYILEQDLSSLNLTAGLKKYLDVSLDETKIRNLVNYPLFSLVMRQGIGKSAVEKMLNQLAHYSAEVDQIKLR